MGVMKLCAIGPNEHCIPGGLEDWRTTFSPWVYSLVSLVWLCPTITVSPSAELAPFRLAFACFYPECNMLGPAVGVAEPPPATPKTYVHFLQAGTQAVKDTRLT